jgi:hypothetical protein
MMKPDNDTEIAVQRSVSAFRTVCALLTNPIPDLFAQLLSAETLTSLDLELPLVDFSPFANLPDQPTNPTEANTIARRSPTSLHPGSDRMDAARRSPLAALSSGIDRTSAARPPEQSDRGTSPQENRTAIANTAPQQPSQAGISDPNQPPPPVFPLKRKQSVLQTGSSALTQSGSDRPIGASSTTIPPSAPLTPIASQRESIPASAQTPQVLDTLTSNILAVTATALEKTFPEAIIADMSAPASTSMLRSMQILEKLADNILDSTLDPKSVETEKTLSQHNLVQSDTNLSAQTNNSFTHSFSNPHTTDSSTDFATQKLSTSQNSETAFFNDLSPPERSPLPPSSSFPIPPSPHPPLSPSPSPHLSHPPTPPSPLPLHPSTLAAMINDALMEQARRQGVDLS